MLTTFTCAPPPPTNLVSNCCTTKVLFHHGKLTNYFHLPLASHLYQIFHHVLFSAFDTYASVWFQPFCCLWLHSTRHLVVHLAAPTARDFPPPDICLFCPLVGQWPVPTLSLCRPHNSVIPHSNVAICISQFVQKAEIIIPRRLKLHRTHSCLFIGSCFHSSPINLRVHCTFHFVLD